jgi:hypothetical protein
MADQKAVYRYIQDLMASGVTPEERVAQYYQRLTDGQPLPAATPPDRPEDRAGTVMYNAMGIRRNMSGPEDPSFQALNTIGGNMQGYGNMHPRADLALEATRQALSRSHDLRARSKFIPKGIMAEGAEPGSVVDTPVQQMVDVAWNKSPTDAMASQIEFLTKQKELGIRPPWARDARRQEPQEYPQQKRGSKGLMAD